MITDRTQQEPDTDARQEERPPVFRRWSGWYALVLGALAFMILSLYVFSRIFQ